jgi:hypothetical protein
LSHDGLTDMDDFGRLIAEAVNAENFQSVAMKQQFENALRFGQ